jgi:hypothetical protein
MARSTYITDSASKSTEELSDVWDSVLFAEAQSEMKGDVPASTVSPLSSQSETFQDMEDTRVPVKVSDGLSGG